MVEVEVEGLREVDIEAEAAGNKGKDNLSRNNI